MLSAEVLRREQVVDDVVDYEGVRRNLGIKDTMDMETEPLRLPPVPCYQLPSMSSSKPLPPLGSAANQSGYMNAIIIKGCGTTGPYYRLRSPFLAKNFGPFFKSYFDVLAAVAYSVYDDQTKVMDDIWEPEYLDLKIGMKKLKKIRKVIGEKDYDAFVKEIAIRTFGHRYEEEAENCRSITGYDNGTNE